MRSRCARSYSSSVKPALFYLTVYNFETIILSIDLSPRSKFDQVSCEQRESGAREATLCPTPDIIKINLFDINSGRPHSSPFEKGCLHTIQ
jgi:hypothetical protein